MEYTPKALPPLWEALRDNAKAVGAERALLVGSALRDADNGVKPTSYSLYLMPASHVPTELAVRSFLELSGPGSRLMRSYTDKPRYELRMGEAAGGGIVNLNFCHKSYMLEADTMARRVPNGLSAIAMNLFTGEINATQIYRLDRDEHRITQVLPGLDPHNATALSVQRRFPSYPIYEEGSGRIISPALKTAQPA